MRPLFRRDSAQKSEHYRLVDFKEGILFADVRIHQHVYLLPYQQIDNGKVYIITENALLHTFLKEVYRFFRILVMTVRHQRIGFGILLDVFKELLIGGMELFDAALIAFQQDFQYISGGGKYILQKFIPFLLTFQYALLQQSILIRKDFIKGTFGNAQ